MSFVFFFFFQAEDGIRDVAVTGVQTCALPIFVSALFRTDLAFRAAEAGESSSGCSRSPGRRQARCTSSGRSLARNSSANASGREPPRRKISIAVERARERRRSEISFRRVRAAYL